ncbi:MAG: NAD(P)H-dependent oxidoreductase [Thiotrichales bacterium]|nr:NAD(P)H-dependent oxidoreductase [Thiotrichales bacterium]
MQTLLRIDASLQAPEQSVSKQLGDFLVEKLAVPNITHLDLGKTPLASVDPLFLAALFNPTPNAEEQARLAESDHWIAQIEAADALVITTPMYNFGMPSQLKNFFDQVLRAGKTFRYTAQGPEGLLKDKPVWLIVSSGGDYREGPAQTMNFLDGHLFTLLNFIGLKQINLIHAAGLAMGDAPGVKAAAEQQILTALAAN